MAPADVSTSVGSIISSFLNGLDVFKKLREKRRAKKRSKQNDATQKKRAADEMQLSQSLRQGPVDIEAEYARNLQLVGERYAQGDGESHTTPLQDFEHGHLDIHGWILDPFANRIV
jgi:hypothetical protein